MRIYNSFFDHQTIDHANFGVELLFDNNLIKLFSATRDNDQIIYRAIKNHNKFKIEESLNERELLHAKIIRDADKIDNLEIKCTLPLETIFGQRAKNIGQQTISDAVFQAFINHETILSNDRITDLDVWLTHLAYIFDLNFKYSFQCVLAHQYIDLLYNRFVYQNEDTRKKMLIIYQEVISYLKKNAKELI